MTCYKKLIEAIEEEIERLVKSEVARIEAGGGLTYERQDCLHILTENCEHLKKYAEKAESYASSASKTTVNY